jgi:hypothetical protein
MWRLAAFGRPAAQLPRSLATSACSFRAGRLRPNISSTAVAGLRMDRWAQNASPPSRPLFHIPAIALALKAGALASTKKLALSALLRKAGVDNVIEGVRVANKRLHATRPDLHPQNACAHVDAKPAQLEEGLRTVQESEQVRMAFEWLEGLEKENQIFSLVLRTYLTRKIRSSGPMRSPGRHRSPSRRRAGGVLKPPSYV